MDFPDSPFPDFGPAPNLALPLDWEAILEDPYTAPDPWFEIDTWHDSLLPKYRNPRWKPPTDSWDRKTVQEYGGDAARIIADRLIGDYENPSRSELRKLVRWFEDWLRNNYPPDAVFRRQSLRIDAESLALESLNRYLARLQPGNRYYRPHLWGLWSFVFDRWALRYVGNALRKAARRRRKIDDPPSLRSMEGGNDAPQEFSPIQRIDTEDLIEAFCRTLPGKHAEIARLAATGMKKAAIARQVGMSYDGVKYAFRSMREKTQEFFGSHYPLSKKPGEG